MLCFNLNFFSLITARNLLMIMFILDFDTMTGKEAAI